MVVLTVVVLGLLVAEETGEFSPRVLLAFAILDTVICGLFLAEFAYRLRQASDRRAYWRRHWIDVVASIPFALVTGPLGDIGHHVRWGRLVRLVRAVRVFRSVRAVILLGRLGARLWDRYRQAPVQFTLALMGFAVLSAAVLVMLLERAFAPDGASGGIADFGDAIWWAVVTVSTVGFGDAVPLSGPGRLVAGVLIVIGVAVFGSCSAILASRLVQYGAESDETSRHAEILARLERIELHLEEMVHHKEGRDELT